MSIFYNVARNKVSYKIKSMKVNKVIKIDKKNPKHNPKAFYQYIAFKLPKEKDSWFRKWKRWTY